jgi:hypothetical protein
MSLLASFISSRIVTELEKQFLSHTPELQQAFLTEVLNFVKVLCEWVENKMNAQGEPTDEKKGS